MDISIRLEWWCVPSKIIKMLQITKPEHILQALQLLLVSCFGKIVDVVDDAGDVSTAVLGHALLHWHKVLPLSG